MYGIWSKVNTFKSPYRPWTMPMNSIRDWDMVHYYWWHFLRLWKSGNRKKLIIRNVSRCEYEMKTLKTDRAYLFPTFSSLIRTLNESSQRNSNDRIKEKVFSSFYQCRKRQVNFYTCEARREFLAGYATVQIRSIDVVDNHSRISLTFVKLIRLKSITQCKFRMNFDFFSSCRVR